MSILSKLGGFVSGFGKGLKSSFMKPMEGEAANIAAPFRDRIGLNGNINGWKAFKKELKGPEMQDALLSSGWSSIRNSAIMAGVGAGVGGVGGFLMPNNIQTQSPIKSAFVGAGIGFGLGATKGLTKIAQPYVNSAFGKAALVRTQKVADSSVTRAALYAGTAMGSFEFSMTKPINRNNRA